MMPRKAWTNERLDDLNGKVDNLDRRMEAGFAEMRAEFRAVRAEISHLTYGLIGTMLVGFLGTIAVIATQT